VEKSLIGSLEERIKNMKDLRRIMNDMKHALSEVKINADELTNFEKDLNDALKFTVQVKELDEWTLKALKTLKTVSEAGGIRILKERKVDTPKVADFVDNERAKQALLERGIEIAQKFQGQITQLLNQSVIMALDFLTSKENAIDAAQKLIGPYRKSEK